MQQAVLDCFDPDTADKYLDLARRTHFENPSMITALSWQEMRDSLSQFAISQFPFPPPAPTEQQRENYTYQEKIRHFSVYVGDDDITKANEHSICIESDIGPGGRPYCKRTEVQVDVTTNYGKVVREWLEANKDILLKNGDIGDWVNVVTVTEKHDQ
jgi:hypothetical protein